MGAEKSMSPCRVARPGAGQEPRPAGRGGGGRVHISRLRRQEEMSAGRGLNQRAEGSGQQARRGGGDIGRHGSETSK